MQKVGINTQGSGVESTKNIKKIQLQNKITPVDIVEKQYVNEKSTSLADSLGLLIKGVGVAGQIKKESDRQDYIESKEKLKANKIIADKEIYNHGKNYSSWEDEENKLYPDTFGKLPKNEKLNIYNENYKKRIEETVKDEDLKNKLLDQETIDKSVSKIKTQADIIDKSNYKFQAQGLVTERFEALNSLSKNDKEYNENMNNLYSNTDDDFNKKELTKTVVDNLIANGNEEDIKRFMSYKNDGVFPSKTNGNQSRLQNKLNAIKKAKEEVDKTELFNRTNNFFNNITDENYSSVKSEDLEKTIQKELKTNKLVTKENLNKVNSIVKKIQEQRIVKSKYIEIENDGKTLNSIKDRNSIKENTELKKMNNNKQISSLFNYENTPNNEDLKKKSLDFIKEVKTGAGLSNDSSEKISSILNTDVNKINSIDDKQVDLYERKINMLKDLDNNGISISKDDFTNTKLRILQKEYNRNIINNMDRKEALKQSFSMIQFEEKEYNDTKAYLKTDSNFNKKLLEKEASSGIPLSELLETSVVLKMANKGNFQIEFLDNYLPKQFEVNGNFFNSKNLITNQEDIDKVVEVFTMEGNKDGLTSDNIQITNTNTDGVINIYKKQSIDEGFWPWSDDTFNDRKLISSININDVTTYLAKKSKQEEKIKVENKIKQDKINAEKTAKERATKTQFENMIDFRY